MIDKPTKHANICLSLNDTYKRKNHDYGDSFSQLRNRLPNAILTRLFDKYLRLETLLNGATQEVKDESINDTLMDMANYCIMELVERGIDESKKTSFAVGNVAHKPTQAEYEELFAEEKPTVSVLESVAPVKGKYDGLSIDDFFDRLCTSSCNSCPIEDLSENYSCKGYALKNPFNFRKIAIAYLEGLEGKA